MKKLETFVPLFVFVFIFTIAWFGWVPQLKTERASASPDTFCTSSAPSTGSSTPTFLTPGGTVATTTVYASAGCGNVLSPYGAKQYALAVQFIASSSVSTLQIQQEFAQSPGLAIDCIATPTACDWSTGSYSTLSGVASTTASLSGGLDVSPVPLLFWKFASSTIGGVPVSTGVLGPAGGNNRDNKVLLFPAPTQYSRWVISMKGIANGNGAVFINVVGKKESGEK